MKEGEDKVDKYLASGMKDVNGWKVGSVFGDRAFFNGDWQKRAAAARAAWRWCARGPGRTGSTAPSAVPVSVLVGDMYAANC
ncbi:MAG: hypothetical protein IPO82_03835 [Betaproteobacteria bacterium]|nr:hypothetical protein [Betaproteobacteria bacterium]